MGKRQAAHVKKETATAPWSSQGLASYPAWQQGWNRPGQP